MIILPEHRLNLVTPPKCGSTSLHEALCRNPELRGIFVLGPSGDSGKFNRTICKHTIYAPMEYHNHDYVVVVRHPRDRFISLYYHYLRWHKNDQISFEVYASRWRANVFKGEWFYHFTIAMLIAELHTNFRIVDIEDMPEFLAEQGINVKLPKLHTSESRSPDEDQWQVPDTFLNYDTPTPRNVGVI